METCHLNRFQEHYTKNKCQSEKVIYCIVPLYSVMKMTKLEKWKTD